MLSSAALASGSMLHRRHTNGLGVAVAVAVFERSTRLLPDESPGYAPCLALSLRSFAHLRAHHHHHCSSADLRASVRTVNRVVFTAAIARSAAHSALASPAVTGVQAPRKHAATVVVNLQQLEGSQASRQPAASAKHALSIEQRALHSLSRTCPCPAARWTCDLVLYHPVFSHAISRRHALPVVVACLRMTSSLSGTCSCLTLHTSDEV